MRIFKRLFHPLLLAVLLFAFCGCVFVSPVGQLSLMQEQQLWLTPNEPLPFGNLSIRMKWAPRLLRNYNVQAIPLRTNCIRLTTRNSQGVQVDQRLLQRIQDSLEFATASISLLAGTGYSLTAEAFETDTPLASAQPIAQGNAANIRIEKSQDTPVPLVLTATDAPTITSFTPDNGGKGKNITITGTHFGATQGLPYRVLFNGLVSTSSTRIDNATIVAEVPAGATSGQLRVDVDGIPSTTLAAFTVIDKIIILPPSPLMLAKQSRPLTFNALDIANHSIPQASLSWSVTPTELASVDQNGVLTSLVDTVATVSVTARSGGISHIIHVVILPCPVSVIVTPATGTLNAQDPEGQNDPGFITSLPVFATVLYSDGASDSNVAWSVSDTRLGYYSNGRIFSALDAFAGTLVLTATANRDGVTKGQASFTITTEGKLEVVIE